MSKKRELTALDGDSLLDLFRTPELDLSSLEKQDGTDQPAIKRPPGALIAAKNSALRELFEQNTEMEQARVLETLADKLGTTALNLSWVNLSNLRLSGLSLPYVNLRAAILNGSQLTGANLRGADLSEALGRDVDLQSAYIAGANARGAVLQGLDLSNARAQNVDWTDADLTGAKLTGALMVGSLLIKTSLARATWQEASPPIFTDSTTAGVITSSEAMTDLLK